MNKSTRKLIICGPTPSVNDDISSFLSGIISSGAYNKVSDIHKEIIKPSIVLLEIEQLKQSENELELLLAEIKESNSLACAFSEKHLTDQEASYWLDKGMSRIWSSTLSHFKTDLKAVIETALADDNKSLKILQQDNEIKALKQSLQLANQTAFAALNTLSETGGILNTIIDLFAIETKEQLAQACIGSLKEVGLKSHIWCFTEKETECFGADTLSKAEESIVLKTRDKRIFSSGNVAIFNAHFVSIFVNNMPTDDPDRSGRLRDILSYLAQAVSARIKSVMLESTIKNQSKSTIDLMILIRNISRDTHKHSMDVVNRLIIDLEIAVAKLVDTDEQERCFEQIIGKCAGDMEKLYQNSCLIEQHYVNLAEGFRKALSFVDK